MTTKKTTAPRSKNDGTPPGTNVPEGDELYRAHQVHTLAQLLFHQLSGTWNGPSPWASQASSPYRPVDAQATWTPVHPEAPRTAYNGSFPWYR